MSKCIILFDVKSMYPAIVIGENISPETKIVEEIMDERVVKYRKDVQGLIPKVIRLALDERDRFREFKKEALRNGDDIAAALLAGQEKSAKVGANATYGVLLYPPFRLFDKDCAGSVTRAGRRIIRRLNASCLKENIEDEELRNIIGEVLYGDTDSIFILLNCRWDDTKAIQKVSAYLIHQLSTFCHEQGYREEVEGKIEAVFDRLIFKYRVAKTWERKYATRIGNKYLVGAKKKYAGRRRWIEGKGNVRDHYIKGFGRSDVSVYTKKVYEGIWTALLDDGSIDKAISILRRAWLDIGKASWFELSVPRGVKGNFKEYTEDAKKGGHIGATLYMIENCGIDYNPMIKPRTVCVKAKSLGGKERKLPVPKRIALLNGMTEPPKLVIREMDIHYVEQAKTILERPFELLAYSVGRQWSEVTTGTSQLTMDKFFDEADEKQTLKKILDEDLEDAFHTILQTGREIFKKE